MINTLLHRLINPLKEIADFRGRSTKEEYWTFVLCWGFIVFIISHLLPANSIYIASYKVSAGTLLHTVVLFVLSIAICIRRIHDSNRSGFWWFLAFLPIIGTIWLLIILCSDGTKGPNDYGPEPPSDYGPEQQNK